MVDESIAVIIRKYLKNLHQQGLPVTCGVLFGSQALGSADKWSDIDLLVVSPRFDKIQQRSDINFLWHIAARTDSRIEPIPVGQRQYQTDDSSAIIEIARREGQTITLAAIENEPD
jgi:predicted nucleotidyltransferase